MDIHTNVAVSGGIPAAWDFIPEPNKEGNDDSILEWLSIYVEDCLSSGTTPLHTQSQPEPVKPNPDPLSQPEPVKPNLIPNPNPNPNPNPQTKHNNTKKRKRRTQTISISEDSPLLHQTQWLAESEPIYILKNQERNLQINPHKKDNNNNDNSNNHNKVLKEEKGQRRCSHCLSHKTPQWREGPMGPKTLCNACGVRFKSGRLLPEYRPAKSPTFEVCKHSNSHKKVMEMRMMNSS